MYYLKLIGANTTHKTRVYKMRYYRIVRETATIEYSYTIEADSEEDAEALFNNGEYDTSSEFILVKIVETLKAPVVIDRDIIVSAKQGELE